TMDWMKRIAQIIRDGVTVVFEGQMRIHFIEEAVASAGISDVRIILVDCSDDARIRRLSADRQQPGLASATMTGWARFVRDEARQGRHEILDTSELTPDECIAQIRRYM